MLRSLSRPVAARGPLFYAAVRRGRLASSASGGLIPPPLQSVIHPKQEVMQLYREVLKTAKEMTWPDEHGRAWGDTVATSARREFDDWAGERDPEKIAERIMVRAADAFRSSILA